MNVTAIDPDVLVQAFNEGSLGLSFGIAGFLVGYLAGAAYLLQELGIITAATKVAGASSGALLSVSLCSGIPASGFREVAQGLSDNCRRKLNCQGMLGKAVLPAIRNILPPDAYKRCSNKAYLSITTGPFPPTSSTHNTLVTDFASNDDMVEAGHASSYIPMWSGAKYTTSFRGQPAYDGFMSDAQPCPPGVKACVRISSKNPPWNNKDLQVFFKTISRATAVGGHKPVRLSSLPPDATAAAFTSTDVFTAGSGSRAGGSSSGFREATAVAAAMQKAGKLGIDIAPGLFSPTGISPEKWEELLIMPGDAAITQHLWELGRRDAQIWARATGLEAAAAAKRAVGQQQQKLYSQG